MNPSREQILGYVLQVLEELRAEWDYSAPIGPHTRLVADLTFESLDLVVLGTSIQEHYQAQIPFAEFLAEIGQRAQRDATVAELVDFVHRQLAQRTAESHPARITQ
jgi:acyl carrier protein